MKPSLAPGITVTRAFAIDPDLGPGYRELRLARDGTVTTAVHYLDD